MSQSQIEVVANVERLGIVLAPSGDPREAAGVLNPAAVRCRDGQLLLYPRVVADGNVSRIARYAFDGDRFVQRGFALEPAASYEFRRTADAFGPGHGCEDPRITFVAALDRYVMAYTAFGNGGPRIAVAVSPDGWEWERLGIVGFTGAGVTDADDKDAAYFPEPVHSPSGMPSIALYHRPMSPLSRDHGWAALAMLAALPPDQRDALHIAYVPLAAALADTRALLRPTESVLGLPPGERWGRVKNGAGTPPIRIAEGWLGLFHGVDLVPGAGGRLGARYSAGIVVHDADQPHRVRFRSAAPLLTPDHASERSGVVDDVVFPTGIDPRPDLGARTFDVYYGMADARVGLLRLRLDG
ncbi:MAG: glycoside hydrolase family 130 protein [Vulcanimicrobiaceae bacterium]